MFSFLQNVLCCKTCHGEFILKEQIRCSLSSKISVLCVNCKELIALKTSKKTGLSKKIEINYRYVYAIRSIWIQYAAIKLFCYIMDLPEPFFKKLYNATRRQRQKMSTAIAGESMNAAAGKEVTLTGSPSIKISVDGMRKTRGQTSRIGAQLLVTNLD